MPYAQWHYPFEHQAEFAAHFPADFICEGVDQTRGWFYSLLALGVGALDSIVYKNVIVNELVLDPQGQKMSKSRGNVVNPWQVLAAHGADAVRLYLVCQSQVWLPKRFDADQIPKVVGGFSPPSERPTSSSRSTPQTGNSPRGRCQGTPFASRPSRTGWPLARLDQVVAAVRDAWSAYDATTGVRALMEFVGEDVSRWYVRRNRPRFQRPIAPPTRWPSRRFTRP